MAISYKVVPRKKPGTDTFKYYATAYAQGYQTLDTIAEAMALESTVTEHDIKAVLSSLQQHIIAALKNGQSVRLGDLGSFHTTIIGTGSDTRAAYSFAKNVKAVRVQFTKSARMQSAFLLGANGLRFRNLQEDNE